MNSAGAGQWPDWSPDLKRWLEAVCDNPSWPLAIRQFIELLATEPRMRLVWAWYAEARKQARRPYLMTPLFLCMEIVQARHLPGKPGNMTPATRKAYFEKVREHAVALKELLSKTPFAKDMSRLVEDEKLDRSLNSALQFYGLGDDYDDEEQVVAFRISPDGIYAMSMDYPQSALVTTLDQLVLWTNESDQWDGNCLKSSDPIVQVNGDSAKVVYFTCSLFDSFEGRGVAIPFSHLATLANVALQLPFEQQVDEDAVRKQVRRYQARQAEKLRQQGGPTR